MIAGDQNSDPVDGDSIPGAAQQLLDHPLVNARSAPTSAGAPEAATLQGGANATHRGDPKFDTADFGDGAPGNLRADYVLPSWNIKIERQRGVLAAPGRSAVAADRACSTPEWIPVGGFPTSDHRLVWVDVDL